MEKDAHSDEEIIEILNLKKVAVIGMSKHQEKAAHFVPKYLLENGFDIIPVNPNSDEILNKKCYKEINDIKDDIDIVDVFRPSEDVLPFVKDAIKKKTHLGAPYGLDWTLYSQRMNDISKRLRKEKSNFERKISKLLGRPYEVF